MSVFKKAFTAVDQYLDSDKNCQKVLVAAVVIAVIGSVIRR